LQYLIKYKINALLIGEDGKRPLGVVSKTDIILCYRHGLDLNISAGSIMSTPVALCHQEAPVESAIKSMILKDLHRLFVVPKKHQPVSGIISLSDAARLRSGSCHACVNSRIKVD
jgi:predicted transcriptional regulator